MVLRLRKVHTFNTFKLNPDDTLTVSVSSDILARTGEVIEGDKPIIREMVNYSGNINTCITADIIYNGEHKGITLFLGEDLTPEMCGIVLPVPEGVEYN